MIILLDLNCTLVKPNGKKSKPWEVNQKQIDAEEYREDLVASIANDEVLLVTWRHKREEEATLASIEKKTGWRPHKAYFRDHTIGAPQWKQSVLLDHVYPAYGLDRKVYFAIESNTKTRDMYKQNGIEAQRYEQYIEGRGRPPRNMAIRQGSDNLF